MQKGWKQKIAEKRFVHFWLWLQKRTDPTILGSTREQNLQESLKNLAKLKENKFTWHWVRPRLPLLNVQQQPRKIYFTVLWKILETSKLANCLKSSQPCFPEQITRQTWYQRLSRFPTFCPLFTASPYENVNNSTLKLETEFASRSMTCPSGTVTTHSLHNKKFTQKSVAIFSKKPPIYALNDEKDEIIRGKLYQKESNRVI